jgi:hypothetical protein
MHPRQAALRSQVREVSQRIAQRYASQTREAAPVLWKYTDPEGNEFYLNEKMVSVRSPYTGKTFTAKPEKQSLGNVGKELKEEAK